jgi:hypothetical protein
MIAVAVNVKVQIAPLIAAQGTGAVAAIETERGIAIAIATKVVIMIETRIGTGTTIEIAIATAHTKARGFTTLQTMVTTATVLTPTSAAIRTAYPRELVTRGVVRATIRIVLTSTGVATLVSSRSSARATRTSRHIGTVFCAATRKASRTGRGTSSAGVFIVSLRKFAGSQTEPLDRDDISLFSN